MKYDVFASTFTLMILWIQMKHSSLDNIARQRFIINTGSSVSIFCILCDYSIVFVPGSLLWKKSMLLEKTLKSILCVILSGGVLKFVGFHAIKLFCWDWQRFVTWSLRTNRQSLLESGMRPGNPQCQWDAGSGQLK